MSGYQIKSGVKWLTNIKGEIAGYADDAGGERVLALGVQGAGSRGLTKGGTGRPVAMAFGNSITAQARPGANGVANQVHERSTIYWAMCFSGWPFRFARTGGDQQIGSNSNSKMAYGIYGYSGAMSPTIAPMFDSVVTPYMPSVVFINCMENDPVGISVGTYSRAQVMSAYDSIIASCNAIGALPVWVQCLPSSSFSSAAIAAEFWAITHYMEARAAAGDVLLVPTADLYMDTSGTTPVPLNSGNFANNTDASVHPYKAAVLIGKRIADVLQAANLSNAATASFGTHFDLPGPGDPRYVAGNMTMSGSGGALSGAAGSVPTNLTLATDMATATVTGSLPAVNGRQVFQVDISTAGAQTSYKNAMQVYTATIATGWSVGDFVQAFWEYEIDAGVTPVGLRCPNLRMQFATSGGDAISAQMSGSDTWDIIQFPGQRVLLATPEIAVPAGCTGLRLFATMGASNNAASVAARIKNYRAAIVNWSK